MHPTKTSRRSTHGEGGAGCFGKKLTRRHAGRDGGASTVTRITSGIRNKRGKDHGRFEKAEIGKAEIFNHG